MKNVLRALAFAGIAGVSSAAMAAFNECPAIGDSPSCAVLITVNPNQSLTFAFDSTVATYDGSDDTLIGVLNDSGSTISGFTLTSSTDIFGFDGDGIDVSPYNAPGNSSDTSGYGGPKTFFTDINSSFTSGNVNFVGGLANGGTTYFGLEEDISISAGGGGLGGGGVVAGVPEPTTYALMALGLAGVGLASRRSKRK